MELNYEEFASAQASNISFVYELDHHRFVYIDQYLLRLLDRKPDELTVSAVRSLIHPDDLAYLQLQINSLMEGNFRGTIHFRILLPEGEKWIRLAPFLLTNANGPVLFGNAMDVTAEINNRYTIEKYANKKNSTLNIIAHDLRGPLSIAKSISESLANQLTDQQSINQINYISTIIKQSVALINSLIEREFMDTVNVELVKKRVNIARKSKEYFEEYIRAGQTLKRNFTFSSSSEEIYIELDESKIMQIYNNLFTNALKFTSEGASIALDIEDLEHSVRFRFTDSGIGIPAASIPILFDKFTEARRAGLHGEPTVGVGLSIVKTIIDWHRGTISVESEVGKGTVFSFELPKAGI